jgi:hypothetical protein
MLQENTRFWVERLCEGISFLVKDYPDNININLSGEM